MSGSEVGDGLDQIEHGAAGAVGVIDEDGQRPQYVFADRADVRARGAADGGENIAT